MNSLACIGCSWMYGYGVKSNETIPYFLSQIFNNITTINAGFQGISIELYPAILSWINKKHNPDYYLIQLTTTDRILWGTDADSIDNKIKFIENNETPCRLRIKNDNKFFTATVGDAHNAYTLKDINHINHIYDKCFNYNGVKSNIENFIEFLKFWDSTYKTSTVNNYNYINYIYLIQSLLKDLKKPYLMYFYISNHVLYNKHCYEIARNINYTNFISNNNKIFTVFDFLREKYNKDWNMFFIDNGYHLSKEGNYIISNEYLKPNIKKQFNL